ncbi:hypothetical protein VTL71DRAFT_11996 [Oculimacula yallundae]|uniref:PNPLA domain-containing protein n=1 Tax=Oculimacula yallundae TaxID=86028 RepID=A0ABR4CTG6_9HELO
MSNTINNNIKPYSPATKHPNGLRLLSLDGGGVKGLSALMILDEIMTRVQKKTGSTTTCRPSDYFELAAGTSTGGIIAIMLFRLRMTTGDAITMYNEIASQVFSPKMMGYNISWMGAAGGWLGKSKVVGHAPQFYDADLKKAINIVVEKYGLDEEDKKSKAQALLARNGAARMFLCTTAQNRAETALFRSYPHDISYTPSKLNRIMKEHSAEATIDLTVCATSAAPTYFPEVKWNSLVFWDGGLLNNNPIDQLWAARYDLVQPDEPEPKVSCILSLGCGHVTAATPSESWFSLSATVGSVIGFATNTEAKGKDFSRHITNLKRRPHYANTQYIRFNVPMGTDEIGLADYNRMKEIASRTTKYLETQGKWLDDCVSAIAA